MDGEAWKAAVHGVAKGRTRLHFHFHFSLSCIGEGNGNPLQCSCLENPRDRGAWWAAVYGVAQSQTRLKRLSSSSSRELSPTTSRDLNITIYHITYNSDFLDRGLALWPQEGHAPVKGHPLFLYFPCLFTVVQVRMLS